jgi:hypothetical protein
MLERSTYEPKSLAVLPILKKFTIVIFMDLHPYVPGFFEDMVRSRRNEALLGDSTHLIEVVDLIHIGVGDKPEVDQLRESLAELTGFELNIGTVDSGTGGWVRRYPARCDVGDRPQTR